MATLARWRAAGGKARMAARGRRASKRGLWGMARIVSLITSVVVGLILIGIVLVLLEANRDNAIVGWLLDAAGWLAEPFDNVFSMDSRKERVAVNYGLAALVYGIAGALIARLLRR
jgi:predicted Kef-type K+ transport protein